MFDHSSCQAAMPDDALRRCQEDECESWREATGDRDGLWDGKPQRMNYSIGVLKGTHIV